MKRDREYWESFGDEECGGFNLDGISEEIWKESNNFRVFIFWFTVGGIVLAGWLNYVFA